MHNFVRHHVSGKYELLDKNGKALYCSDYFNAEECIFKDVVYTIVSSENLIIVFDNKGRIIFDSSSLGFACIQEAFHKKNKIFLLARESYGTDANMIFILCDVTGTILSKINIGPYVNSFWQHTGYPAYFSSLSVNTVGLGLSRNRYKCFITDKNGDLLQDDYGIQGQGFLIYRELKQQKQVCRYYYDHDFHQLQIDNCGECFNELNVQIVSFKSKFGVVNETGHIIIPCEYDSLLLDTSSKLFIASVNGKYGLLNLVGDIIIPLENGPIRHIGDGMFGVFDEGKWGYRSLMSQKTEIPCQYDDIGNFSGNLAPVKKAGKWGYINKRNDVIIPFLYDTANPFIGGLAIVSDDTQEAEFLPKQYVSNFNVHDELPYSPIIPSWVPLNVIIQNCGITTCIINGIRYIYTTVPIFEDKFISISISGSTDDTKHKLAFNIFYHSTNEICGDNNIFKLLANNTVVVSETFSFSEVSFNELTNSTEYKAEIDISTKTLDDILTPNEVIIEIEGSGLFSYIVKCPQHKRLAIKYILATSTFSEEDRDNLINWAFPKREKHVAPIINSNDGFEPISYEEQLKDCINRLLELNLEDLDLLYKLISSPKDVAEFKQLLDITQDSTTPHPLVKLLSKVPNKTRLLEDIKTANENRTFQAKHKLISAVFKKKTELNPETIKFIDKIKHVLK